MDSEIKPHDKRKSTRLALVLALCVVGITAIIFNQSRPRSAGELLREAKTDTFQEALAKITTNEISILVEMLRAKDSNTRKKLIELTSKFQWLQLDLNSAETFHYAALAGFQTMGTNAVPAIPQLAAILESGELENPTALCLAVIGREALPVLVRSLTNQSWRVQHSSASALGFMEAEAESAVPALLLALQDKHLLVRYSAAEALGNIKMRPDIVIPALIKALDDEQETVKWNTALALGNFGDQAKQASPHLIKLINANLEYASPRALEALRKIDPSAAARLAHPSSK